MVHNVHGTAMRGMMLPLRYSDNPYWTRYVNFQNDIRNRFMAMWDFPLTLHHG